MFQAAYIAKAKQALASCYEDATDTTFITKLESFDDGTNVKVFELVTSTFSRFYNYLFTLLLQNHCIGSLIIGDLSSVHIAISSVFTLFQAKSLLQNAITALSVCKKQVLKSIKVIYESAGVMFTVCNHQQILLGLTYTASHHYLFCLLA